MGFGLSLLVEVLGGVATAILLGVVIVSREASTEVGSHDREAHAISEDAQRYIRDRNRVLHIERALSINSAGPQLYGGSLFNAVLEAQRDALHEYRDEMTIKRRRYRELHESESLRHKLIRRKKAIPRFALTNDSKSTLAEWRADVTFAHMPDETPRPIDDPTKRELEPELRRFEDEGDPPIGGWKD
jgi:hypothetical protein